MKYITMLVIAVACFFSLDSQAETEKKSCPITRGAIS